MSYAIKSESRVTVADEFETDSRELSICLLLGHIIFLSSIEQFGWLMPSTQMCSVFEVVICCVPSPFWVGLSIKIDSRES